MLKRVLAMAGAATTIALCQPAFAEESQSPPQQAERLLPQGYFLADDGQVRPFSATHQDGRRPFRREPHFVRAALEDLTIIAIGTTYYWIQPHENMRDWDFPGGKKPISGFVPSFDTNRHVTNDILHPMLAGSLYYWFARSNGLTIPWAFAYSVTSSAMFEFFFEWLERASINDLVMTPGGGFAAGELWTHLGDYVGSAPHPSTTHDVLNWTLGFANRLHKQRANGPKQPLPPDNLGFSSFYWHRFQLMLGSVYASNDFGESTQMTEIDATARIVSLPGHLKTGTFSTTYSDGEFTEGALRVDVRNSLQQTYDMHFAALLAGYYEQDIGFDRRGHAWTLGVETAYDFAERIKLDRYDAWALLHLIGIGGKYWAVDRALVARLELSLSPDFAVVQNQVWPYWRKQFGMEGTKLQLQQEGYDFEYGGSVRAKGVLEIAGVELGARAYLGTYGSFDRWYRFQGDITRNVHQSDQLFETEAWIGFTAPESPLHIQAYAQHTRHTTTMAPWTVKTWDTVFGALAGLQF